MDKQSFINGVNKPFMELFSFYRRVFAPDEIKGVALGQTELHKWRKQAIYGAFFFLSRYLYNT
uniref:hypothetical protein n=1 Tax=Clostridia TaxID=186801 RepID=UPI001A9A51CE